MEELIEALFVAGHHLRIIAGQALGEVNTKHPADRIAAKSDACFGGSFRQAIDQLRRLRAQIFIEARPLNDIQRCHTGSHRHRIAR